MKDYDKCVMALQYMVNEYIKASGANVDDLPAFVTIHLPENAKSNENDDEDDTGALGF